MISLQMEHEPVDQEIVNGLIASTPEWWGAAILDIELTYEGGIEGYSHKISSPEGHKDYVEPTDELYNAVIRLWDIFRKYKFELKKVSYRVSMISDGQWDYEAHYTH